jgi:ribonuclease HI
MLATYGLAFSDAQTATADDLALLEGGLVLPQDGALVKSQEDQTVYLISNGQRYGFVSSKVFTGLGYKFSSVLVVTNPELQALPRAENLSNEAVAHMDGADVNDRGNPGPSASGFVIQDQSGEQVLETGGKFLGITTNNQAEYRAVLFALQRAKELQVEEIEFRLDSLLVVNQMKGIYKVKNKDLAVVYEQIKKLVQEFKEVKFVHVLREYNKLADAKANRLMDENS